VTPRRHRRRWDDIIRMDIRGVGWEGVGWIFVAHDLDHWRAVVNSVLKLRVA
jgi:hypothetical protein